MAKVRVSCPVCGKWFFDVIERPTTGQVKINQYCRRCKKTRFITIKSQTTPLHSKESVVYSTPET